jgi:hypothetical protein
MKEFTTKRMMSIKRMMKRRRVRMRMTCKTSSNNSSSSNNSKFWHACRETRRRNTRTRSMVRKVRTKRMK